MLFRSNVDTKSDYSSKFLCAYLKSSFFIWLLINKHDNINVYEPDLFNELRVPDLNFKNDNVKKLIKKVETEIDIILSKENDFLKIKLNNNNYEDEIIKHNSIVDIHAKNIDSIIYELLDLKEETQKIIESTLNANKIYFPKTN